MLVLDKAALYFSVAGTGLLVVSPFLGAGKPLLNNYIPVLQHPLFFWSIGLFSFGVLIQCVRVLSIWPGKLSHVSSVAPYVAAVFTLVSILVFFVSWSNVPSNPDKLVYYEFLFWGPGHVLQFNHTSLLLFSWLILLYQAGGRVSISDRTTNWLFLILLLPLIYVFYIYVAHDVFSPFHLIEFTDLMKYGGLLSLPLGLVVSWAFLTSKLNNGVDNQAIKATLITSVILFATGGVLGFMIHGVNVVIPAHYHGSIVGVTLAFMGVAYYLLPKLGYRKPVWKMARMQPWVYAGGQLMHVLGLAWSGGYGVQRKTAGSAQGLDSLPEIVGMGMMGLGGLISIIGGVMFLIVMLRSMWPER